MSIETNARLTYTKDMLVKDIAERCGEEIKVVKEFYNTLEDCVFNALSSADCDNDVVVRLFEGITLNSTYVPETTKINNLTGKVITSSSKIRPRAKITRSYCGKLTDSSKK